MLIKRGTFRLFIFFAAVSSGVIVSIRERHKRNDWKQSELDNWYLFCVNQTKRLVSQTMKFCGFAQRHIHIRTWDRKLLLPFSFSSRNDGERRVFIMPTNIIELDMKHTNEISRPGFLIIMMDFAIYISNFEVLLENSCFRAYPKKKAVENENSYSWVCYFVCSFRFRWLSHFVKLKSKLSCKDVKVKDFIVLRADSDQLHRQRP